MNDLVQVVFKMPEELRKIIKVHCINNGTTMQQILLDLLYSKFDLTQPPEVAQPQKPGRKHSLHGLVYIDNAEGVRVIGPRFMQPEHLKHKIQMKPREQMEKDWPHIVDQFPPGEEYF